MAVFVIDAVLKKGRSVRVPFLKGHKLGVGNKYRQGQIPWNKGTKGLTGANKTSFKKGQRPQNYQGGLSFFNREKRWIIVCRGDKKYAYARGVMECKLKRKLTSKDIVHHINEDTTDDRPENLQLETRSTHIEIHRKQLQKVRKRNYARKIKEARIRSSKQT